MSLENVEFKTCKTTGGNGGGLYVNLDTSTGSVTLHKVKFTTCTCVNGNGGGLGVKYSNSGSQLDVLSVIFSGCSVSVPAVSRRMNAAPKAAGGCIYVEYTVAPADSSKITWYNM